MLSKLRNPSSVAVTVLVVGGGATLLADNPITVGIALLIIAVVFGYYGAKKYQFYRHLTQNTDDAMSLSNGELANIDGRVKEAVDTPLEAPITGDESMLATWLIEEWNQQGETSQWARRGAGIVSVPYTVTAQNGQSIRVSIPNQAATREQSYLNKTPAGDSALQSKDAVAVNGIVGALDAEKAQVTVEPDETPPQQVQTFLTSLDNVEEGSASVRNLVDFGRQHGKRRYTIQTLGSGDKVFVHGEADATSTPTTIVAADPYTVVSSMSGDEYRSEVRENVRFYAALILSCVLVFLFSVALFLLA